MRLIQTFFFDEQSNPLKNNFGWIRPEFNLMSWALSCLQLNKMYGDVELYTNNAGVELLVKKMKLPYSKVHTTLNNFQLPDHRLWAMPKIMTYALQDSPFLHVDGDVYIFEKFSEELLQKNLISQNLEIATSYYTDTQKELEKYLKYLPDVVENDFYSGKPIHAVNAGILGGNNIDFLKMYSEEAIKYIFENTSSFKYFDVDKFNVFFEQHLFYALAQKKHLDISYLFQDIYEDLGYNLLGNLHEVPSKRSYIHLLGHFKKDEWTCLQMANKLLELYPEYFFRIIKMFKEEGCELYSDFYNKLSINQVDNYNELISKSIETYSHSQIKDSTLLCTTQDIRMLNEIEDSIQKNEVISSEMYSDFIKLKNQFFEEKVSLISHHYMLGRDLLMQKQLDLFLSNTDKNRNLACRKAKSIFILQSRFNWSAYYNKLHRTGVEYYDKLDITQTGIFHHLVIPDLHKGYNLFDIDEIETLILTFLDSEKTIDEIFIKCRSLFDEEVLLNYSKQLEQYIMKTIQRLLLINAVQVFENV